MKPELPTTAVQRPHAKRPKRRGLPLWHRRWVRAGVIGVVLVAVGGAGAWMWRNGHVDAVMAKTRTQAIDVTSRLGFNIRDILVTGRHETSRVELLNALGLRRGVPILAFHPEQVRQKIEKLPWVRKVSIERRLPDAVYVDIRERHPLALWQREGRHVLVDVDGVVITAKDTGRFSQLPLIIGVDAPMHAGALLSDLSREEDLAAEVKAAIRVGMRRWDVMLGNGVKVRLPEENQADAWSRFAAFQREHDVLSRDVGMIDMRVPDRLIVRLRDAVEPDTAAVKKTARGA